MISDFITPETLFTFGGMVLAVGLFVQATKGIVKDKLPDVWVRLYAFVVALVVVFIVYCYKGAFAGGTSDIAMTILLGILNALAVTLAAMGGYEAISDPLASD